MSRRKRKNISGEKDNSGHEIEAVRITGTKWYADVEYRGQVARFHGELCINGFAATASGSRWIKHKGPFREEEMFELMRAAHKYTLHYTKTHSKAEKWIIDFYDDDDKKICF